VNSRNKRRTQKEILVEPERLGGRGEGSRGAWEKGGRSRGKFNLISGGRKGGEIDKIEGAIQTKEKDDSRGKRVGERIRFSGGGNMGGLRAVVVGSLYAEKSCLLGKNRKTKYLEKGVGGGKKCTRARKRHPSCQ